jgi:hypothetical protein
MNLSNIKFGVEMANRKVDISEVRARFHALGHTPIFDDSEYYGALSKLRFICANCGEISTTTCGSLRAKIRNKTNYCVRCSHQSGVVSAAEKYPNKVIIKTRDGDFTYRQAEKRYGIPRSMLKSRYQRGWSNDEICGLVARKLPGLSADRKGFIYGWWCKTEARYVYIGLTTQSVKTRTNTHIRSSVKGSKLPFHKYIRIKGTENFEIHTIWSGPSDEVSSKEIFYIEKYRTHISNGGLNVGLGGSVGCQGGVRMDYNGVTYSSLKELWRASGSSVSYALFCKSQNDGLEISAALEEEFVPHYVPITVQGREYRSKAEAFQSEAQNVTKDSFYKRLEAGWTPEQALGLEDSPPKKVSKKFAVTIGGKEFPTIKQASLFYGIPYGRVKSRLTQGWALDRALELKSGEQSC